MFKIIRQKLIDIVEEADKIGEAHRTAKSTYDKWPAAVIKPSQNEADYSQTAPKSNMETYIFAIDVFYPFTEGQENADLALEEAIDELIGIFRDRNVLEIGNAWVEPVPTVWGFVQTSQGWQRQASLTIRVRVYVENGT